MKDENVIALLEKFQSLNLSATIDFNKFNNYAITHHSTPLLLLLTNNQNLGLSAAAQPSAFVGALRSTPQPPYRQSSFA